MPSLVHLQLEPPALFNWVKLHLNGLPGQLAQIENDCRGYRENNGNLVPQVNIIGRYRCDGNETCYHN